MAFTKVDEVLKRIQRTAGKRHFPIIGSERGQVLVDLVSRLKPRRILEVGTLVGYSAILMGKELESDAEIITIEIDKEEATIARTNIRESQVKPKIEVLIGDASEVIPKLEGKFDLVFLDGNKHQYLDHLLLVEARLHKGSAVVADNVGAFAHSMRDYLAYVRDSGKYESRLVRVGGDGVEVSTKLYVASRIDDSSGTL